ncbi:MAG TPA: signal peptidase I [Lachnoclostridium phytofermentans]|uniref:Signal peptidase I n=1 Tax=Lachnoclostridium phytofermentans TaxID=66219 RepID=A0A3D2X839_9FIRM|nr:signal peptidase I [Lachnoclostridium sp.]HCL03271.1 signal peptidase I [Lachnoclostridium phytofermentans]
MEDKPVDGFHDLETEVAHTEGKSSRKRIVLEILIYIVALYFAAFIVPRYILQRTIVVGDSMETTLQNGENLWVEKISYHFDKLKRFDVIVFYPHGKEDEEYYIKRIIGLPGEKVQIIGEEIFINGKLLTEDFGKDPIRNPGIAADPIFLAEDEYFVLGDNRTVSLDSRYEEVGPVKKENIGGRAIFRLWPINKMGPIK